jgi:hypothetical protein
MLHQRLEQAEAIIEIQKSCSLAGNTDDDVQGRRDIMMQAAIALPANSGLARASVYRARARRLQPSLQALPTRPATCPWIGRAQPCARCAANVSIHRSGPCGDLCHLAYPTATITAGLSPRHHPATVRAPHHLGPTSSIAGTGSSRNQTLNCPGSAKKGDAYPKSSHLGRRAL